MKVRRIAVMAVLVASMLFGSAAAAGASPVHLVAGTFRGIEHFKLFTGRCPVTDHTFDATFRTVGGLELRYHARYCGNITDGNLFTGTGTFRATAPDGASLYGSFATQARLPSTGEPYALKITGGTQRFRGFRGACVVDNHLRVISPGVQAQFGRFGCVVREPRSGRNRAAGRVL